MINWFKTKRGKAQDRNRYNKNERYERDYAVRLAKSVVEHPRYLTPSQTKRLAKALLATRKTKKFTNGN